jgi:hypothetical protein
MMFAFTGIYLIQVNVDDFGFPPKGWDFELIPNFFVLDDAGKRTGETIDGAAWESDIPRNMGPALKAFFDGLGG